MKRIYMDNAATTQMLPEVLAAMMPYYTEKFGNPSSIYSYGRESKIAIENARKSVARLLNAKPGEIFFTSGGTESANTAINAAVRDLGCKNIITSSIEHKATLQVVEDMVEEYGVKLHLVNLTAEGHIDLKHLEELLSNITNRTLVCFMHANNEIGNLLKIKAVGDICKKCDAIFYSDMVQTIGHYNIDLKNLNVHFVSGSAHKFHGPKGVGVLYVNENLVIKPFIKGGSQERNLRAGTENIYGIVGFAKALEIAIENIETESAYIKELKLYMIGKLRTEFTGFSFNGDAEGSSLYTILNVSFPKTEKTEMLIYNLDMAGICVSGGSACASGTNSASHVINAINSEKTDKIVALRFSFSKFNTKEEIDIVVTEIKNVINAASM